MTGKLRSIRGHVGRGVGLRRGPVGSALAVLAVVAGLVVVPAAGGSAAIADGVRTAQPVAVRAAVPVGKLTPRGCTVAAGAAVCDLFAMAGTASMLGTSIPIWGFSSVATAGSATAPGPLLVVQQGDQVTVNLHNQLPGQQISLAFPGQAPSAFTGTTGDDTSGIASGSDRSYRFTANRPGTFAYEAGHTSNGARQVAMGLAGALVVLPADGSAYGAAAGMPATSYDDEAVLVMSEVDPALNADPLAFDMRNFRPRYRTFNGKPYPATDEISTDQGHNVLLRYVNVGSQSHSMSVLGGDQVEIAQDGHQMKYQSTVTAESVEPGQTLDTLVRMPTGPEAKLALYEPAMHLDNNGQHNADPLQFAFGGMLTFLDTNAPPPSTDGVGPVASHATATPNPSDGTVDVTVTADLSDATTGGSPVAQAEFVVDDAVTTGVGYGIPMTASYGTVGVSGATGTLPAVAADCSPPTGPPPVALNCLSAGRHTIYVRALDAAGNWGSTVSVVLNLPKTGPQTSGGTLVDSPVNGTTAVDISATGDDSAAGGTITAAEYFLDTQGADGTGVAMTRNRVATIVSEDATIPAAAIAGLAEGTHHVLVHSKDSLGLWGPVLDLELVVDLTGPQVIAAAVAPNPSNGILTSKGNSGYLVVSAQISDTDAGGAPQSNLVDAETFLDPASPNPAGGSGLQLVAVDGALDAANESVYGLIPISQIRALSNGTHRVAVRGQDASGTWGPLYTVGLVVDKTAPVIAGPLTGAPNPTNGAANLTLTAALTESVGLGSAEFWVGTTDPGVGKGTRVSVSVTGGNAVATVPLVNVASGTVQFNLRVQDTAGNWSNALSTSVVVSRPNLIFANNFEPADPAWSGTTGLVAPTAAAAQTAVEPGSTRGLSVTLAGGRNNVAGYLTDASPTAETTYHARFAFNRNTLTPGNGNVLTLFDGRSAGNAAVFAVQYRVNGGQSQIRTVLSRAGGTVNGNWVVLPTGSSVLQVDWAAGPATGAGAGYLQLKINGSNMSNQTGNTSALRLDTVLLGVTGGFTGTSSGAGYFDSFLSTRVTLP
ncbi:multicopper oxidase domain-containing protein [Nakamurella panacisegetis]|nr:multicopper oxidase domain-containing protein [Nakamurella panacisegetis]